MKVINDCINDVLYIYVAVLYSNFILYFVFLYITKDMRLHEEENEEVRENTIYLSVQ